MKYVVGLWQMGYNYYWSHSSLDSMARRHLRRNVLSKAEVSNGQEQIVKSVCRGCHGGCGVFVHVQNGKVLKVSPDPDSPLSKGWMCIKGLVAPEIVNHPNRLQQPLRRKGARSAGQWEKISWQEALNDIAARLDKFRKESGAESIALGQGTGRHHYMHTVRFANALGTPNWYEPGLAQCFIPRIAVSNLTYGGFVTPDYYGSVPPGCIMFWGNNPLVSSPDGKLASCVKRALDHGAVGIAIDPRRSETAAKCKLWLPIIPGTDAALALAMIHVIINEQLFDKQFVEKWTSGFEELKEHTVDNTPEWAEQITGIKSSDILEAARTYAMLKPAVLEWGVGIEQNCNSLQTVRAVAILRALTGNLDVPGGDILGMNIVRSYPTLRDKLPRGMLKKRLGADRFKLLGGFRAVMPSAHIPTLFGAIRTGKPYKVRALMIFGNNPLCTIANAKEVYESLLKLDLLVVTDLFMTPTAEMADYVLPAAYWPEIEQIIAYPLVAENIVFAQQKAVQVGQCRQDEWIMDQLAKKLNLPGSDQTFKDVMNYQLEPLGVTYDQIKNSGFIYPPHQYKKYVENGFRTVSRKVELYSNALKRIGYDPLPSFKPPSESPSQSPELAKEFPYILTTGSRRKEFFHSEHRQIGTLRRSHPDPLAELHPSVAAAHGISQGNWIIISSPRGSVRMKAMVTPDINPKVVNIEHGWWFPEKARPEYGVWESNANVLTNSGPPYDTAFGSYQLRGLLCKIAKAPQPTDLS